MNPRIGLSILWEEQGTVWGVMNPPPVYLSRYDRDSISALFLVTIPMGLHGYAWIFVGYAESDPTTQELQYTVNKRHLMEGLYLDPHKALCDAS
jgi:hypothetical protein